MNIKDKKHGKLMVVEDDAKMLGLLKSMFDKFYDLNLCTSGEEALEEIKKGFKPEVIICDQFLPGMKGDEFLNKSLLVSPNTIRIIITADTHYQDIIKFVTNAKAFLFISKPFETLEFMQAVRISFAHYNLLYKAKFDYLQSSRQIQTLNQKNKVILAETYLEKRKLKNQVVDIISRFTSEIEKYYFTNHTKYVREIATAIAYSLDMPKDIIENIDRIAFLHSIIYYNIPENLILQDPYNLVDAGEKSDYFNYFYKAINIIRSSELLNEDSKILTQMWEHKDGTGFPNAIIEKNFSREAQIVSISNIYHNLTYRLSNNSSIPMNEQGFWVQTEYVTDQRHKSALKFINENRNWFSYDLLSAFSELVKKKKCKALIPITEDLTINWREEKQALTFSINEEGFFNIKNPYSEYKTDLASMPMLFKEIEISIKKLFHGMILSRNVLTVGGILAARSMTEIDDKIISNLSQLEEMNMLKDKIWIYVRKEIK